MRREGVCQFDTPAHDAAIDYQFLRSRISVHFRFCIFDVQEAVYGMAT